MKVEKSSFGYKLTNPKVDKKAADTKSDELTQHHLQFVSGLIKRLRNLFLSVVPADYCGIMLAGVPESSQMTNEEADSLQLNAIPLIYLGQEIGILKYHLTENVISGDDDKIKMLADLFGYLIYYHLLMYEFLTND